jgi:hypothetical protein
LPTVGEARSGNARALTDFHSRASMLLPLWARKGGGVATPSWLTTGSAEELVAEFSRAGLLDFRLLDDAAIISWLTLLDRWPAELPRSLDLGELGLTEADIAAQRDEAERIKWERLQARRSVALDGRPVALDPDRVADLIERLREGLSEELLRTSDRPVRLEELEERRRRKPGSSKGGEKPGRRPPNRMTSDQTELIGFMGEVVADEWLRRRYGSSVLWRSHYRRFALNDGDLGNDDLGFDFEVLRVRRGALMFEVKATTTDDLAFELSETEIAVAQENAGHDRYRILFVGRVNDSEERWPLVGRWPRAIPDRWARHSVRIRDGGAAGRLTERWEREGQGCETSTGPPSTSASHGWRPLSSSSLLRPTQRSAGWSASTARMRRQPGTKDASSSIGTMALGSCTGSEIARPPCGSSTGIATTMPEWSGRRAARSAHRTATCASPCGSRSIRLTTASPRHATKLAGPR